MFLLSSTTLKNAIGQFQFITVAFAELGSSYYELVLLQIDPPSKNTPSPHSPHFSTGKLIIFKQNYDEITVN